MRILITQKEEDIKYLIEWYDIVGIEEMTFALERAAGTIMSKVYYLRKQGLMKATKIGRKGTN